jgi:hypothetical protein
MKSTTYDDSSGMPATPEKALCGSVSAKTALQFLNSLRPALPLSIEQPCKPMSNGELRRHMQQGGVLVNTERVTPDEPIDFPVFSLVFFPKSQARRTTLV